MPNPCLTFFCELDLPELEALVTPNLIDRLSRLKAGVSLALVDLSPGRAEVVRRLNAAGIPVGAWLLLPKSQGYYFNLDSAALAPAAYREFRAWARREGLSFAAVGLDIEPDLREIAAVFSRSAPRRELAARLPGWLGRFFRGGQLRRARRMYAGLIEQIHADGYAVETYQFPFITDERRAHTSLLQRLSGMVDLPADCEVLMLYSSFYGAHAPAVLTAYGREVSAFDRGRGQAAIGVGITGGGVSEPGLPDWPALAWEELARDLRLAWQFTDRIYIFSLEGCAAAGHLDRLESFVWDQPTLLPETAAVDAWRRSIQSGLWIAEQLPFIFAGLGALLLIARRVRRRRSK